jgi:surface carbohydrate biosynthesis protein
VFVSSYRLAFDHINRDQAVNEYTSAQERAHSLAFKHALRYAEESNMDLTVIAKGKVRYDGEHFAEEKAYFERLAGENEFTLSSTVKDTFNSYHHALTAEFVIGLDSTLLYEAFSVGGKALFCWGADQYLLENAKSLTEHLPKPVLLESINYAEFFEKVNFARGLSDQAYKNMIAKGQSEYVNSAQRYPVHEQLKHEINAHLGQV